MKTTLNYTMMLVAFLMSTVFFSSCSSDDDNSNGQFSSKSIVGIWKVNIAGYDDPYIVSFNQNKTVTVEEYVKVPGSNFSILKSSKKGTWKLNGKKIEVAGMTAVDAFGYTPVEIISTSGNTMVGKQWGSTKVTFVRWNNNDSQIEGLWERTRMEGQFVYDDGHTSELGGYLYTHMLLNPNGKSMIFYSSNVAKGFSDEVTVNYRKLDNKLYITDSNGDNIVYDDYAKIVSLTDNSLRVQFTVTETSKKRKLNADFTYKRIKCVCE